MTDAELDALVALGEGITPGPWLVDADDSYSIIAYPEGVATCVADTDPPHLRTVADDGEAMANARAIAAVPDLIAAIRTLQTEKVELRSVLNKCREAVTSLDEGSLGMGSCVVDFHDGREEPYPFRDELLAVIDQALSNIEEPRHDT